MTRARALNDNAISQHFLPLIDYPSHELLPEFKCLQIANVPHVLQSAIYHGWFNKIKYVIEVQKYPIAPIKSMIVRELAYQGHLEILQYFIYRHNVVPSSVLLHHASLGGQLAVLKWLHETLKFQLSLPDQDKDFHKNYLIWILRKGHLNILQWLVEDKKYSLTQINKEVKLTMEACRYHHWHIVRWLVIEHQFYLHIDLKESKTCYSLLNYLKYHTDAESWQFICKVFDLILSRQTCIQHWDDWLAVLKEKYHLAIELVKDAFYQDEITYQYGKIIRKMNFGFSLIDHLSNDLIKWICNFLSPCDIFTSVQFINTKYYQIVNSYEFISNKYQQYFGIDKNQTPFVKTYYQFFKSPHDKSEKAQHACLTENLSYSTHITFDVLTFCYPNFETVDYFYSFLIKTNRIQGINYFASQLLTLSKPAELYQDHFPIIMATRLKQLNVIKKLLEKDNTIINQKDDDGYTALMWAAKHGYTEIVEFLLKNKANLCVNYNLFLRKYSPLDDTFMNRHLDLIPILLNAYANIPKFEHFIKHPMIWAAKHGYLDIVQVLYYHDKKFLFEKDANQHTPLLSAIINGHANIVEFCLQKSSDLLCYLRKPSFTKRIETALELAFKHNQNEVKLILAHHIYQHSSTLPDFILSKMKSYLSLSQSNLTSFFSKCPNLDLLNKKLINIHATYSSHLDTIEMMLEEIIRVHNLFVSGKTKIDDFLIILVQDALIWLFGHDQFLSRQPDKSLDLQIPDDYWFLLKDVEGPIESLQFTKKI